MTPIGIIQAAGGLHAPALFLNDNNITELHPSAPNLQMLAELGYLHAVLCTGPLNPSGSHFDMIRIQEDLEIDLQKAQAGIGWANKAMYLTNSTLASKNIVGVMVQRSVLPRVLQGPYSKCIAMNSNLPGVENNTLDMLHDDALTTEELTPFWRDLYVNELSVAAEATGFDLNFNSIGNTMAEVLKEQPNVKCVYGISGGFDNHTDFDRQFSIALSSLDNEIGQWSRAMGLLPMPSGMANSITTPMLGDVDDPAEPILMVLTDFSRDMVFTSAQGLSHGRGGVVLIIGRNVKPGFTNGPVPRENDPRLITTANGFGRFLPVITPTSDVVATVLKEAGWAYEDVFNTEPNIISGIFNEDDVDEPADEPIEDIPDETVDMSLEEANATLISDILAAVENYINNTRV